MSENSKKLVHSVRVMNICRECVYVCEREGVKKLDGSSPLPRKLLSK